MGTRHVPGAIGGRGIYPPGATGGRDVSSCMVPQGDAPCPADATGGRNVVVTIPVNTPLPHIYYIP